MYYTVQSVSSYIGRSFMDGDGHQMLIQNSSTALMMWPNGLAIDYKSKLKLNFFIFAFHI